MRPMDRAVMTTAAPVTAPAGSAAVRSRTAGVCSPAHAARSSRASGRRAHTTTSRCPRASSTRRWERACTPAPVIATCPAAGSDSARTQAPLIAAVRAAVSCPAGMTHRGRPVWPSLTTMRPLAVGSFREGLSGKMLIHLQPSIPRSGQAAGIALAKEPGTVCTAGLGGTSARPSASATSAEAARSTQASGAGSSCRTSSSVRKRTLANLPARPPAWREHRSCG